MFKYVHHVHYVVKNRDEMVQYMEKNFGMKPDRLAVYEGIGTIDAHYDVGKTHIQISEPMNDTTEVGRRLTELLATRGPGIFHVAWAVDNIHEVHKDLTIKGNKLRPVNKTPRNYFTANIDPESSLGVWFQLAEG